MVCLDPRLSGRQLVLRRSMVKFECLSNRKLEVIKWSAPMNMFLNRPLIAILEHHGIKADVSLYILVRYPKGDHLPCGSLDFLSNSPILSMKKIIIS